MEYGAYGSAPDGLPENFGLTDTLGRKPFCEVGVLFIGQPGFHNMAAVGGVLSLRYGLYISFKKKKKMGWSVSYFRGISCLPDRNIFAA